MTRNSMNAKQRYHLGQWIESLPGDDPFEDLPHVAAVASKKLNWTVTAAIVRNACKMVDRDTSTIIRHKGAGRSNGQAAIVARLDKVEAVLRSLGADI